MKDLEHRLRNASYYICDDLDKWQALADEAAKEIDRLKAKLAISQSLYKATIEQWSRTEA